MQQKNGLQTISQFGLLLLSKDKKNNLKSLPTFVGGDFLHIIFLEILTILMKKITKIIKCFFYIFINLFFFNFVLAQDINIEESVSLSYVCELEKKILKNSEYNYQTFLAKDLEAKDLEKFEISAKQPKTLLINGLSLFLSKEERLIVKVVNKDIVLFKAIDKEKNYSESGIIDRKSGELIHEITKKLKSENSEKDISFYSCSENEKKV
jgi:hypothetical protein